MENELRITESTIPGLFVVNLPVHGDSRGWFKENWQNQKFRELGFPAFKPIQNNISFNEKVGTTRGIHAEPWDKYVSVANGKVFGAWVDLREGESFGQVFTIEISPGVAVYVPRGVGNAFQTLEPNTSYTYLVNSHWSPTAKYTFLNLADETANIQWPISLSDVEISEKDLNQPRLSEVVPFKRKKTVILGANGQLGKALKEQFPDAVALARQDFDLSDTTTWTSIDWPDVETIINGAAYTKVDEAESDLGRPIAWATNAVGVGHLAKLCEEFDIKLVHVSSDYVFDGSDSKPYLETDSLSPLSVYGQSKAAGDLAVAQIDNHYIVRTSWVIGEGPNFVNTMINLAKSGKNPKVVTDQFGRLSFADEIAKFISKLLESNAPSGVYNFTNGSEPSNWHEIAEYIFESLDSRGKDVDRVTTSEYLGGIDKSRRVAPRPKYSVLDLTKSSKYYSDKTDWKVKIDQILKSAN